MRYAILLVMTGLLLAACSGAPEKTAVQEPAAAHAQKASDKAYRCPMCPGHESDEPGKCSGCGMNLEAVAVETTTYGCPMCPGHESDKPGKCSGCGMNLEPVAVETTYGCPMCAGQESDEPGKCAKCGMNLVPVAAEKAAGHAGHGG